MLAENGSRSAKHALSLNFFFIRLRFLIRLIFSAMDKHSAVSSERRLEKDAKFYLFNNVYGLHLISA
jgi:hypothetical protein